MKQEYPDILQHLIAAVLAGGVTGFERSFHGRPAGFRTHTLVCIASSLLMLVTLYQREWFSQAAMETVRIDPTRMAQGIMTGIGFLGAGVIFKESLTVRGLTTAASIWVTAAIGIMLGIGFYFAATAAVVLTLGTLSVFRWIETKMPVLFYAHFLVRFARDAIMPVEQLRALLGEYGFTVASLSYRLDAAGDYFEYRTVIRTIQEDNARRLALHSAGRKDCLEFRIAPTGD